MLNARNERVKRLVVERSECRGGCVYKKNESDDAGRPKKDTVAITRKQIRDGLLRPHAVTCLLRGHPGPSALPSPLGWNSPC